MKNESKFKNFSFKGKVIGTLEKKKKSSGYLTLPSNVKYYSIKEGARSIRLDILPYIVTDKKHPELNEKTGVAVEGTPWFRRPFAIHRNIGADNETVVCPRSIGQRCPICEYQLKRFKAGAPKEETVPLLAKERSLYIVIPEGTNSIAVWDISDKLFYEELADLLKEKPENEAFFWIENGKTLSCRVRWETLGTNSYPEVRPIDFEDREDFDYSMLEEIPSLDDMLVVHTYAELEMKFHQLETEDTVTEKDVAEEAEEVPVRRRVTVKEIEETIDKNAEEIVREDVPIVRTRKNVATEQESSAKRCPHGHTFGKDLDQFKECGPCRSWDACDEENRKLNAN